MICYNCGEIFDIEDAIEVVEAHGERHLGCPYCGVDDMGPTKACKHCGEEFDEEDLLYGYCPDCLYGEIDFETALAYMKDTDTLADFICTEYFDASEVKNPGSSFNDFMEQTFHELVKRNNLPCNTYFIGLCRDHCMPGYPKRIGLDDYNFAEWYAEYAEKRAKSTKQSPQISDRVATEGN